MNKISKIVVGSALMAGSAVVWAKDPISISGNVAMTSDYVWRGYSQTLEDPAIQGGFDIAHESGVYVGTWASNVDFGGAEHIEIDGYFGYSTEFAGGFGLDVGYNRYFYPSADGSDFGEVYIKGSYGMIGVEYYYSPDWFTDADGDGKDDTAHYIGLSLDYELPEGFGLGATVGMSKFPDVPNGVDDDYIDWSLSVSKSFMGLDFSLAYTDTDVDNDKLADGRAVFTVSKEL